MATVNTGGYNLTTTGQDLSGIPYKAPTVDPRLVRRLVKGNSSQGSTAYVSSLGAYQAADYLERAKLTPTEWQVKQLIDQGIGVLDEPVKDITPTDLGSEIGGKIGNTIEESAQDIASVTEVDSGLRTLSKASVLKAIQGLISKGYLYTS